MSIINNHVHISMAQSLTANSWSFAGKSLEFGGFGLFPKYELTKEYTIVMLFEPKSGFFPLLFSWIKPKRYLLSKNTDDLTSWIHLFPWYWSLSHKVRGIYIQRERLDSLDVNHTITEGGLDRNLSYHVNIRAKVNPERLFTFLLTNEANTKTFLDAIQNRISEEIDSVLNDRANNPSFIHHFTIKDDILEKAGYQAEDCRIQYVTTNTYN